MGKESDFFKKLENLTVGEVKCSDREQEEG